MLRDRGLLIDDTAEHYLKHLNYYRLAGYWRPFEQSHSYHLFKQDVHFRDVLNLYIFDRELRLLVLDSIERIELSRWLKDLKPAKTCNKIAKSYELDFTVLTSFVEHLTYLRNLCAHHSRVWNRKVTKTMQIPRSKPTHIVSSFNDNNIAARKIYNSLVMIIHFLNIISPGHHFKNRLYGLIEKHSIDVIHMGFPLDWQTKNMWNKG